MTTSNTQRMPKILPTRNEEWGMWGTSARNGYDPQLTWDSCSRFFQQEFGLAPARTRTLLDGRFGRHLADDLSFMPTGPSSAAAIASHLADRFAMSAWRRWYARGLAEARVN